MTIRPFSLFFSRRTHRFSRIDRSKLRAAFERGPLVSALNLQSDFLVILRNSRPTWNSIRWWSPSLTSELSGYLAFFSALFTLSIRFLSAFGSMKRRRRTFRFTRSIPIGEFPISDFRLRFFFFRFLESRLLRFSLFLVKGVCPILACYSRLRQIAYERTAGGLRKRCAGIR